MARDAIGHADEGDAIVQDAKQLKPQYISIEGNRALKVRDAHDHLANSKGSYGVVGHAFRHDFAPDWDATEVLPVWRGRARGAITRTPQERCRR